MLLTTTDARDLIETDLSASALQLLLDDAEALIVDKYGAVATRTEEFVGGARYLFTTRLIGSLTSITEWAGSSSTVLTGSDYALRFGNRALERLDTSGAPRAWGWRGQRIVVLYELSADETTRRKRVQADLVKLAITYRGAIKSEASGDYSAAAGAKDYQAERETILRALSSTSGVGIG